MRLSIVVRRWWWSLGAVAVVLTGVACGPPEAQAQQPKPNIVILTAESESFLDGSASTSSGSSRYLIRNASLVLTMDPNLGEGVTGLLTDSDVLIEDDRIAAIGQNLHANGAKVVSLNCCDEVLSAEYHNIRA